MGHVPVAQGWVGHRFSLDNRGSALSPISGVWGMSGCCDFAAARDADELCMAMIPEGAPLGIVMVIVAGKVLMREGEVLTADEDAIRAQAQAQAEELAARVAADPVHQGMALLAAMAAGRF
jgi:hypothetical protein